MKHTSPFRPPSIAFTDPMVQPRSSGTTLVFDSDNNGERARNLALSVDLFTEAGEPVGSYSQPLARVFPGCSLQQSVSMGTLAEGCYRAFVLGDAGDNDLFAEYFKLKV